MKNVLHLMNLINIIELSKYLLKAIFFLLNKKSDS